jgi:hypothetical protein
VKDALRRATRVGQRRQEWDREGSRKLADILAAVWTTDEDVLAFNNAAGICRQGVPHHGNMPYEVIRPQR